MEDMKDQGPADISKGTRRRFKPGEKKRILKEAFGPGASSSLTARKYGKAPSVLYN
jgi:transposase-like protein